MYCESSMREWIAKKGVKISYVAQQLEISDSLMSNKLSGKCRFTACELVRLMDRCGMSNYDANCIFGGG